MRKKTNWSPRTCAVHNALTHWPLDHPSFTTLLSHIQPHRRTVGVFVRQYLTWFRRGWGSCLVFVCQCLTWFRGGWGVVFGFLLSFYFVFLCLFFLLLSIFFFLFFFFLYIFVFLFFLIGKSEILILCYVVQDMVKTNQNMWFFYKFSKFLKRFQCN